MATLAGTVIDKARDRHAAFDRKRVPDRMARRFLSDYVRQLHGKIAAIDPEALRVDLEQALPLVDHDAGIALPANRYVASVVAWDPATANPRQSYPVVLINAEQADARNSPWRAAWTVGSTLFLRGPASAWTNLDSVAIAYIPIPVELTTLDGATGTLPLPDTAELACVEQLAFFMARRGAMEPNAPPIDVRMFADVAQATEAAFLVDIANRLTGQVFFTRDDWP